MSERTPSLYDSLVGSSIEFNFKNKLSITTIEQNIVASKRRIAREVDVALSVGGELCVMLLAELTNFYRKEPYYMAVRGSIKMRRYRESVLEYLELGVQERSERLLSVLSEAPYRDKNRDLKISIARYFLGVYPKRLPDFKKLLTREEYTIVA